MNQWQPNLFRNTSAIYPYYNNPGWNLITAQADDTIQYLDRITAVDKPAALLHLLCTRGCARAPSPNSGVD